ncbi:hypothetical protein ILUMI_05873 [Ignelater luminosus]|uniref:Uncharacterized protein n=1 Tax=Ignelater luminosus TaxID=2038154 RepID=A0A8K0GFY5_IGNLU|nr:hypothetical protein ILUMI_05873 [Ignelater luminosus]
MRQSREEKNFTAYNKGNRDKLSTGVSINKGLPQGSVIDLLLFSLYTSELCERVKPAHMYSVAVQLLTQLLVTYHLFLTTQKNNSSVTYVRTPMRIQDNCTKAGTMKISKYVYIHDCVILGSKVLHYDYVYSSRTNFLEVPKVDINTWYISKCLKIFVYPEERVIQHVIELSAKKSAVAPLGMRAQRLMQLQPIQNVCKIWYFDKMQFLNDTDTEGRMDVVITSEPEDAVENDVTIQQQIESTNEILGGQYEISDDGTLLLLSPSSPKTTAPASRYHKTNNAGTKINSKHYQQNILTHYEKELRRLYPNNDGVFHQDSAPSHASKSTIKWLKDRNIKFIPPEE